MPNGPGVTPPARLATQKILQERTGKLHAYNSSIVVLASPKVPKATRMNSIVPARCPRRGGRRHTDPPVGDRDGADAAASASRRPSTYNRSFRALRVGLGNDVMPLAVVQLRPALHFGRLGLTGDLERHPAASINP